MFWLLLEDYVDFYGISLHLDKSDAMDRTHRREN